MIKLKPNRSGINKFEFDSNSIYERTRFDWISDQIKFISNRTTIFVYFKNIVTDSRKNIRIKMTTILAEVNKFIK